jgi:hypothetical protein
MPVANQGEGKQQKGDQQQAASFCGISRVPPMLAGGVVLGLGVRHGDIVTLPGKGGGSLVLHYARR